MRKLKRVERASLWFYHEEYAAQVLGAIEFYAQLPLDKKHLMEKMVSEIVEATP